MPELPEVETTKRGITPHIEGQQVSEVILREKRLRWPVTDDLVAELPGCRLLAVSRRGKYLLIDTDHPDGRWLMIHLGMSGRLRVAPSDTPVAKHDHLDICLANQQCLRFHDPRRFGSVHWLDQQPETHALLSKLGPEPLSTAFNGDYLHGQSRGRRISVKPFLMDSHVVVGVGNIYANEALHLAGISPRRAAGRISKQRYEHLVEQVVAVLQDAIQRGGTTLRDYANADGQHGFFQLDLKVYGRGGEACKSCGEPIRQAMMGQRATYWCSRCQQ